MTPEEIERVENFLENWIDANILRASTETPPEGIQHAFLTDAVAAGIPLDAVNAEWELVERRIKEALTQRRF